MVCDLELNPNAQGLDRVTYSREEQVEKKMHATGQDPQWERKGNINSYSEGA